MDTGLIDIPPACLLPTCLSPTCLSLPTEPRMTLSLTPQALAIAAAAALLAPAADRKSVV